MRELKKVFQEHDIVILTEDNKGELYEGCSVVSHDPANTNETRFPFLSISYHIADYERATEEEEYCARILNGYRTKEEAVKGHQEIVEGIKSEGIVYLEQY